MTDLDGTPLFRVTRVDGWPVNHGQAAEAPELPGATFHVVDPRSGQPVATYRSEDAAGGLPHEARVRIAQLRAETAADRRNREHGLGPAA